MMLRSFFATAGRTGRTAKFHPRQRSSFCIPDARRRGTYKPAFPPLPQRIYGLCRAAKHSSKPFRKRYRSKKNTFFHPPHAPPSDLSAILAYLLLSRPLQCIKRCNQVISCEGGIVEGIDLTGLLRRNHFSGDFRGYIFVTK